MLIVNSRFLTQQITGVQRFAIEISLRLKEIMKDDVVFVAPKNIVQHEIAEKIGVKIIGRLTGHLWEQWDLPRWLNKNGKPLLLNMCNVAPVFYKNKVSTIHDVAFVRFPQTFSKLFLWMYRFLMPRIVKTSRIIVTVSEFSKKEIVNIYNVAEDKVKVVYSGVIDIFKKKIDEKVAAQQYYLAVSSINYRKNFISVLQAFEAFCKKNPDGNLYIIGDLQNDAFKGSDFSKYESNPRVKFLGRVDDESLVKYYSNAIAFLFPSLYEGFGLPPLEAQRCGCPVIASNSSSLPEVLSDSVLMCNPLDIEKMSEYMSQVRVDSILRQNLIAKGFQNESRFAWKKNVNQMVEIISFLSC